MREVPAQVVCGVGGLERRREGPERVSMNAEDVNEEHGHRQQDCGDAVHRDVSKLTSTASRAGTVTSDCRRARPATIVTR